MQFLSVPAFFIQTSKQAAEYRLTLFNQIHQIVFHGKGGYDWYTVYNMPIWLRKFTFLEIQKFYEEENRQVAQQTRSAGKGRSSTTDTIDFANPDRSKLPQVPGMKKLTK